MRTRILAALGLLLVSSQSWAVMLSLSPATQNAMPGDSVSLDLTVSGLGDGVAPSIGAFSIGISFDDAALSFTGGTFGLALGDSSGSEAFASLSSGTGSINLLEVSLLSVSALDALQGDTIVLATLAFTVDVLALGSSTTLDLTKGLLGDGFGNRLDDVDTAGALIRNPDMMGVPEPGSLLLWGIGLLAIGGLRGLRAVRR